MGLNDTAWEKLFDKYQILDRVDRDGQFQISASQIKEFREPRLMTKFDHRVNLPAIFRKHNLAILPVTRGDYVISSFSAYQDFEAPEAEVQRISVPAHLQSLMPKFLVSEAIALNCANACGILSDFLEDEALVPTVSGRMSSGGFAFRIDTALGPKTVSVDHAQIEIDAAYEGLRCLSLFEAKRDLSDDFLIRQLYYPFRVWSGRVTKPVKTVFLIFPTACSISINISLKSRVTITPCAWSSRRTMSSQPRSRVRILSGFCAPSPRCRSRRCPFPRPTACPASST